jgi:AraC family transcriptional regulator
MSQAISIIQGAFGRVALLDMDRSLVTHAHHACHVLIKYRGTDTAFEVRGASCHLNDNTAVVVNAWERHAYTHGDGTQTSHILALYIDPGWLAGLDRQLITSGHQRFFATPELRLSPRVATRAHELGEQMTSADACDAAHVERCVFDLMIDVVDAASEHKSLKAEPEALRQSDFRIRRAMMWLREHAGEALDLDAMASVAGLSRAHFFAQFKAMTGLRPRCSSTRCAWRPRPDCWPRKSNPCRPSAMISDSRRRATSPDFSGSTRASARPSTAVLRSSIDGGRRRPWTEFRRFRPKNRTVR